MNRNKIILIISSILAIALIAIIIYLLLTVSSQKAEIAEAQLTNQQLQDNLTMAGELAELNAQFEQHENDAIRLENDTILAKYNAAKSRVEELLAELNSQKIKSAEQIQRLRDEIATLRGLLRHYIAQVDSLGRENAALRQENTEVRAQNEQLTTRVNDITRQNETLNERITLAEKLNVTGVTLTALNKKGKNEKNVTKARQLLVTFTIPQNNSTPVGNKTIYLRITGPEGSLLGAGGSFSFEGQTLQCTAKKTIDYAGDEIAGIKIYWDVNATLNPGDYTVELFADNFRLTSRHFTLKK
ncbi:MAG: hypothetical protein J6C77_01585 [Muribaculaceae bacterium]|nr:hypothetical protein [Muribaculaceae bacterium]